MKKLTYLYFVTVLSLSLASCGEGKKEEVLPAHHQTHGEVTEEANVNLDDGEVGITPEFTDQRFAVVYQEYTKVKTALVNSEAEESGRAGAELLKALQSVEAGEETIADARVVAEHEDINQKRTAFRDLSAAVGDLLEGKMASGDVYLQYCPMAFDGGGAYWLSASQEIRNPYLPQSMLTCGSVRDTL